MLTRCCAAAVAVLVLLTSTARAQGRPVELGIDAGGSLDLSSGNAVVVGVPVQDFRAGSTSSRSAARATPSSPSAGRWA